VASGSTVIGGEVVGFPEHCFFGLVRRSAQSESVPSVWLGSSAFIQRTFL